ncbi:MAG: TM2 domain-containing protein [Deltaproteobacteria bacterium]|nr:TM2 domain-containing protein [Deltaproteobacteria bacterium]
MSDNQEEILDKIRERVLERERELRLKEDKEATIQATLQALEEITEVPREEMERIADEIRTAHETPTDTVSNDPELFDEQSDLLPATVREALSKLPVVLKDEFWEEYQIQSRSIAVSYLLWLIPPPFSCHYLYSRNLIKQILFTITCGGLYLWWFVDFFRVPQIVKVENRNSARKILRRMLRHSLNRKKKRSRHQMHR